MNEIRSMLGLVEERKTTGPLATHLDSPIKDHMVKLLLRRKNLDPRFPTWFKKTIYKGRELLEKFSLYSGLDFQSANIIEGTCQIQVELLHLKERERDLLSINHLNSLNTAIQIALKVSEDQQSSLGERHAPISHKLLLSKVRDLLYARHVFQQAVIATGSASVNHADYWDKFDSAGWVWKEGELAMYVDKNWFFIIHGVNIYVGIRDSLLGISDIISQRIIALLHSQISLSRGDPTVPTPDKLNIVYEWGDSILYSAGNQGYDLLSSWESLCVGVILEQSSEQYWDGSLFLNQMMSDFNECGKEWNITCDSMVNLLKQWFKENPNIITQVHGLYRIWGHPLINAEGGIAKLKQHACKIKPINSTLCTRIECVFKERFCMDYKAKHGKWPNLDISELREDSYLAIQLSSNNMIQKRDPRYNLLSWKKVKANKTIDILPEYNLVSLLSDKAMSFGISDLQAATSKGSIGAAYERSVLVQWLKSSIGDPRKFLEDISQNGFGEEEVCVGVCPKERELKLWARMFGLLTLRKRMYVVVTEAMLATHILPYFPEITMLDNQTKLMKKMYMTTSGSAPSTSKSFKDLFTSIDFQKWNSNMRFEETEKIFEFMDGLFGLTNCFTRTHEMFSKSWLYLADGTYLPHFDSQGNMIPDQCCWRGHKGGIEGLRQKGWTIFTVCIIRYALEGFDHPYSLMGQGDNQVLKISYSMTLSSRDIHDEHKKVLKALEKVFSQIGPSVKASESWTSSNFFSYGKFPILKGCPLSSSLKKICRMFPLSNEGYPTLESSLSAISANLIAACNASVRIDTVFITYLIQVYECIIFNLKSNYLVPYSSLLKRKTWDFKLPKGEGLQNVIKTEITLDMMKQALNCSPSFLRNISIFPRCLGGYPIVLYGSLFSNGFPDPVSESISLLKHLSKLPSYYLIVQHILSPQLNPHISSEMICEDPVSLNLLHPSSSKEVLKRMVQDYLKDADWISNQEFKSFIHLALERQEQFCDFLLTMTPFNPRVAHCLKEATLIGRATQVIGQLEKTNTLIKLMLKASTKDATTGIVRSDLNYFISVLHNLSSLGPHLWHQENCSTTWAQLLRDKSWQQNISGVTVAPITESFFPQQNLSNSCVSHLNAEKGYFLYITGKTEEEIPWIKNSLLGPYEPYIGSITQEKTQSYGKELSRKSQPLLKNAARILTFINWITTLDSNMSKTIIEIFNSITDLDPLPLIPQSGQVSGSGDHRVQDESTKHGGTIPILYTVASWCHLSSNTLTEYSKGGCNVNLHFQALMSHAIVWASQLMLAGNMNYSTIHYHVRCSECIRPINEDKIDFPHPMPANSLKSLPGNPICWIPASEIETIRMNQELLDKSTPIEAITDISISNVFHQLAGQSLILSLRYSAWEKGENKVHQSNASSLSYSWMHKLDIHQLLIEISLNLISLILFRFDFQILNKLKTAEEIIRTSINIIDNIPKYLFRWASPLYQVESCIDQMKILFPEVDFPASTPVTYHESYKHFSKLIICTITRWNTLDQIPNRSIFVSKPSPHLDQHPIFLHLTLKILRESDPNLIRLLKIDLTSLKTSLSSFDYSQGNNYDIKKVLENHLMLSPASSSKLHRYGHILRDLTTYKTFWIIDHLDNIGKSLPSFLIDHQSYPVLLNSTLQGFKDQVNKYLNISDKLILDNILYRGDIVPTITDKSIHSVRTVKGPTSAWYKFLGIIPLIGEIKGTVVCLADGAGGFSLVLSRFSSVKHIYYATKFNINEVMDQGAPNFIPSAFVGFPTLRKKLISLRDMTEGSSDILQASFFSQLQETLSTLSPSFLVCDAEGSTESPNIEVEILNTCLEIGHTLNIDTLLIKVYIINPIILQLISGLAYAYYEECYIIRSLWSSTGNKEFYLLVKHARNLPWNHSITKQDDAVRFSGFCLSKRNAENLFNQLSLFSCEPPPSDSQIISQFDKLLESPYNLTHKNLLLTQFLGSSIPYNFPIGVINHQKKGVQLIRMGGIKRRIGFVNLLKLQKAKLWCQAWITMLIYENPSLCMKDLLENFILIVHRTSSDWSFGVLKKRELKNPCTKIWELKSLLTSSDFDICYNLSGLIRKRGYPVINTFKLYYNIFEASYSKGLI